MSTTRTIWKYPFFPKDIVTLTLPKDAKLLHVALQNGQPTLWAMVDPQREPETVTLRVYGTGHTIALHDIDDPAVWLNYIGTVHDGPFIWHVFEVPRFAS